MQGIEEGLPNAAAYISSICVIIWRTVLSEAKVHFSTWKIYEYLVISNKQETHLFVHVLFLHRNLQNTTGMVITAEGVGKRHFYLGNFLKFLKSLSKSGDV